MLRTAPNFSNSTNTVPAHSSRHQTSASYVGFLLKRQNNSAWLLWGSPISRLPHAVRNAQFRSFPCQLSIITVVIWLARHIWTLIAFPWSNNHTFSSLSCGTLLHSVIDSWASPQQEAAAGEWWAVFTFCCLLFWALFVALSGFLMVVSCWRHRLQCIVIMQSFLRLLKLHKLVVDLINQIFFRLLESDCR